jgi:Uncharacterized vancomycin resistance protein
MKNTKVALFFLCVVAILMLCGFSARSVEVEITVDGRAEISGVYKTCAEYLSFSEKLFAKKGAAAAARLVKEGATPDDAIKALYPTLYAEVLAFCGREYKPCTDASVKFLPNTKEKFVYSCELNGSFVDDTEIFEKLTNEVGLEKRVSVSAKILTPDKTVEKLKSQTVKRGEFTTYYGYSAAARRSNIERAATFINGTVLSAGEIFSFNQTVGARSTARGFLEAPIIVDGKYVGGTGGGVCQVSTTVYNAALHADMEIVTVSRHSLPVGYVPPSFDAMVSSASDFSFKNPTAENVYIEVRADGKYLKVVFYGLQFTDTIELISERVRNLPYETELIEDTTLPLGTEETVSAGQEGLESKGYIVRRRADGTTTKTQIRRDVYLPQKRVIKIGIGVLDADDETEEPLANAHARIDFSNKKQYN